MNGCDVIICEWGGGGCECGDGWLEGWVGGEGLIVEFYKSNILIRKKSKLNNEFTGKNPGGKGPPGIPSFGGIWLRGLGAGPAF